MDHVYVKYGADGTTVADIVVIESKYATGGGAPRLARTDDKVQQLSNAWFKKQRDILYKTEQHPELLRMLESNPDKIRFKANVLDETGVNKWYDYGKFDSNNIDIRDAVRTPKPSGE